MPTAQPIEDWKTITPETLFVAVKHIRETFDLSVWKCSSVTEKLCFADLHPYDEHAGLNEYRSAFLEYRRIIGQAASQRFDNQHDRGTAPDIFYSYMQAMSEGIRIEIRRVFGDLLQIGIAHSGILKDHPAEWAKQHLLMLINGNKHVVKMWIKAVCDKHEISAETKEDFEEAIYWRSWRAPKLIYMKPSGNLEYDSVSAWSREDQEMTEKLLEGLSARFVQSLEFELDSIAGNAHVELAKTAGTSDDRRFAMMAIEEVRKSVPEDERPHPEVGAVVVKNGVVLGAAHRGELLKSHAEYIALDDKLADDLIAGATVYTTLEPCTTRKHPKIPCAQRLVDRKVARVFIGMLDPNPDICGRGDRLLSDAGIETQLFPRDLRAQVEDMNREFIRSQKNRPASAKPPTADTNPVMPAARSLTDATRNLQKAVWSFYSLHTQYGVARAARDVLEEEKKILEKIDAALTVFSQDYDFPADLSAAVKTEIGNINIALVNLKTFSMTGQATDMEIAATQIQDACERVRNAAKPHAYRSSP